MLVIAIAALHAFGFWAWALVVIAVIIMEVIGVSKENGSVGKGRGVRRP